MIAMFDDEPPALRAMLDRPDHRPPGARLILTLLILVPVCWAGIIAGYVLTTTYALPTLRTLWSALS